MADVRTKEKELEREISRQVEDALPDVEVLAVELSGRERFRVYVDSARGVDHALCERVTHVLGEYLRDYSVEVSSPGFERPLRRQAHFERVVGRKVTLRTSSPIDGRTRFRGELVAVGDHTVSLAAGGDGEAVDIPYDSIVRGNLIDER